MPIKKQLGRTAEKEVKLRRRAKGKGGVHMYINMEVLNKSLEFAGMDIGCQNLFGTARAVKDGKRAKVIIHIFCR